MTALRFLVAVLRSLRWRRRHNLGPGATDYTREFRKLRASLKGAENPVWAVSVTVEEP